MIAPARCPKCQCKTFYIDVKLDIIDRTLRMLRLEIICTKCGLKHIIYPHSQTPFLKSECTFKTERKTEGYRG